ncbi:MAG: SAP domain-containing protein [Candidatus Thalassarchaeaceae archaeon]
MFFGRGKKSKAKVACPLCEQQNDEGHTDCIRCGYKLGRSGNHQQGSYVEQQTSDIFSALMEEDEEELESPMVDWSQTTFTMDDVTIEVSQYNDDGEVSLSSTPKFASKYDEMPDDAKNIIPSNFNHGTKETGVIEELESEGNLQKSEEEVVEGGPPLVEVHEEEEDEELDTSEEEAVEEDLPLVEVHEEEAIEEDLPLVEAIPDEDLPLVGAIPDEDLPLVGAVPDYSESITQVEHGKDGPNDTGNGLLKRTELDPTPAMEEEELLSLTSAELRSMLSSVGASTIGDKTELVKRFLESTEHGIDTGSEESQVVEEDAEVNTEKTQFSQNNSLGAKPPLIPEIISNPSPKIESLNEEEGNSTMDIVDVYLEKSQATMTRSSYWPWPQEMPWIEKEIAVKLRQSLGEAKEKRMGRARELLDEVGPHLGDRTRLLFPVCRLLQALGRGDEVPSIIEGAEGRHPSDPAVTDARDRLGV